MGPDFVLGDDDGLRRSKRTRKPAERYNDDHIDQHLNWAKRASLALKQRQVEYFPDCPTYYPSIEELKDFFGFIKKIEPEGKAKGLAKIVVPEGWWGPCKHTGNMKFPTRVQPLHELQEGKPFKTGNSHTFQSYKDYAEEVQRKWHEQHPEIGRLIKEKYGELMAENGTATWEEAKHEVMEDFYWLIVDRASTETMHIQYANDLDTAKYGTAFTKVHPDSWDLTDIAHAARSVLQVLGIDVEGMTHPWLYYGCLFSSFCWHTEDHYMYSINYMHAGSPKTWYGLPSAHYNKFEATLKTLVPKLYFSHPDLLHQLVTMISPSTLKQQGIDVCHTVQKPGELVVTWPQAFHAGFSHGWNCAEAVNFASSDWLPMGRLAQDKYADVHSGRNSVISLQETLWSLVAGIGVNLAKERGLENQVKEQVQMYYNQARGKGEKEVLQQEEEVKVLHKDWGKVRIKEETDDGIPGKKFLGFRKGYKIYRVYDSEVKESSSDNEEKGEQGFAVKRKSWSQPEHTSARRRSVVNGENRDGSGCASCPSVPSDGSGMETAGLKAPDDLLLQREHPFAYVDDQVTQLPIMFNGVVQENGFTPTDSDLKTLKEEYSKVMETELNQREYIRSCGVQSIRLEQYNEDRAVVERFLSLNHGQPLLCEVCGLAPYFAFGTCPCRPGKVRCVHHLVVACDCPKRSRRLIECVPDDLLKAGECLIDQPKQISNKDVYRIVAGHLTRRVWRQLLDKTLSTREGTAKLKQQEEKKKDAGMGGLGLGQGVKLPVKRMGRKGGNSNGRTMKLAEEPATAVA